MGIKGLGSMLAFLGVGSFVLPFFGLQFRVLSLFGEATWVFSLLLAIIGIMMMVKGKE